MLPPRAELRFLVPLVMVSLLAQACQGMSPTVPTPNPRYTPPPAWLTPGGFETEMALRDIKATNVADSIASPMPGTLNRMNISDCLDNKVDEACVEPFTRTQLINEIQNQQKLLNDNKASISDYSFAMIDQAFFHLLDGLNKNEQAVPAAVQINPFASRFPESTGGRVDTIHTVEGSNIINLYLPLKDSAGFPPDATGLDVHEKFHAAMALLRYTTTGSLFKPDEVKAGEFSGSKYQSQTEPLEEYQADFLGGVYEVMYARTTRAVNDERYKQTVQDNLTLHGIYSSNIAYWLDGKGIRPEDPIWQMLFDIRSIKHYKTMSEVYGNQPDTDQYQSLVSVWNNYAWTLEEKAIINEMVQQGVTEGWIEAGVFPPIP